MMGPCDLQIPGQLRQMLLVQQNSKADVASHVAGTGLTEGCGPAALLICQQCCKSTYSYLADLLLSVQPLEAVYVNAAPLSLLPQPSKL